MEDRNYSEEIAMPLIKSCGASSTIVIKSCAPILTEQGEALKRCQELLAREVLEGDELDKLLEGVEAKRAKDGRLSNK